MATNILILAAGKSPSTGSNEDDYPICLAELDGVSLIERIVGHSSRIDDPRYTFTVLDKEARRFHLDNLFRVLIENARVIKVPEGTKGSACTALLSACQLEKEMPLIIISANELVDIDFNVAIEYFKSQGVDVGVLAFSSVHPRYSFVKLNEKGAVIQVAQRNPISKHATTGMFWFKRTGDFVEAAMSSIRKGVELDGSYYVAPTINELILKQKSVGIYQLQGGEYRPLKNEKQLAIFEKGGIS